MYEVLSLTKEGYKTEYAESCEAFDFRVLKARAHKGSKYISIPATFDIETSRIKRCEDDYEAFMYIWQMCVEGYVVFGRTWQQLIRFLEDLEAHYRLHPERKLVIYVHNLSYEFQFLKTFLDFKSIFAMDAHKILTARTETLEFRCSYILSNMSLAKFIKNTPNTYHLKGEGDLDYKVLRTPTTNLTALEYGYCYNDVLGLYEAIMEMLRHDTITSIKLTSTGFVRRDCRNSMRKNKKNRKQFVDSSLDLELYKLARECFRGGNTASNRYHTNRKLFKVGSWDISSSYPYCMLAFKYPTGPFMNQTITSIKQLDEFNAKYCTMGRYIFKNLRVKKDAPIPYIPISKVISFKGIQNGDVYNGRVMYADELATSLTNIDYECVKQVYNFDSVRVVSYVYAYSDYLPKELTDVIFEYFEAKSKLKGDEEHYYEYVKAKNKLNAIYGMCVTDIVHEEYEYVDGEIIQKLMDPNDMEVAINKYYKSRNNFLTYQWGVWVTAYARRQLQRAINRVGLDVVYCDTDSCKYIGEHDADFEVINEEIREYCRENNRVHSIEVNGKVYELGVFDKEETYDEFKTLGAKKYAFKIGDNYGLTVAGLNKKKGAAELAKSGGLDAFRVGKVFNDSGRTTAQYNEMPMHILRIEGQEILTGSNIAIVDTTYTLGMTEVMLGILDEYL